MKIAVELWSDAPSAVEATSFTFQQLGCSGIAEEQGQYFIDTGSADPGFIRFAAEAQGYVRKVVNPALAVV